MTKISTIRADEKIMFFGATKVSGGGISIGGGRRGLKRLIWIFSH